MKNETDQKQEKKGEMLPKCYLRQLAVGRSAAFHMETFCPEVERGEPAGAGASRPFNPQAWMLEPFSSLEQPTTHAVNHSFKPSSPAAHHNQAPQQRERDPHTQIHRKCSYDLRVVTKGNIAKCLVNILK